VLNYMKIRTLALCGFVGCLAVALATPTSAQIVNLGGSPTPGHARPPLFVNFGPFKGSGNGNGPNSTAGSVYYTPAQIRHAYGFDQLTAVGAGQTIAIIDAYGSSSIQSDLNTFCSDFNIASTTVTIDYPQGKPISNAGWAEETSLDVEWAHAIAPGAKIVLVAAKSASYTDLLGAVDYAVNTVHATVVSMSWGGSESSAETGNGYDSHFIHPGVTFVASSGDNGAGVEWPAASPYVVGVGGTSLSLDANNNRTSETAWSGSGGGISAYESVPGWQSSWTGLANRCVPDVSYVADPNTGVLVVYKGGLYVFGGTSVGAPQWAALVALSQASLTSADATLYSVAVAPAPATAVSINLSDFYDITSGNDGTASGDFAGPGYDLVTGLGSPAALGLVSALSGVSPTPDFALAVSPSSQTVTAGSSTSYTVTVSASGGYAGAVGLSVTAGLPGGATASFSPSTVNNGSGSATLKIQTSSTTPAGTYTLAITGTGTPATLTHTVNATLVVNAVVNHGHGKP
jgi:subtilase family serine protease